ncbi:hypothetical protein [Streptomyces sp. NPDC059701]|uniref:hypothetical protein n=1 Tax=Streptomyces sp. NPDC059701 TaxID=3346914 RepID=UPI0036B7B9A2
MVITFRHPGRATGESGDVVEEGIVHGLIVESGTFQGDIWTAVRVNGLLHGCADGFTTAQGGSRLNSVRLAAAEGNYGLTEW